jgi:hypothetical protein
MLQEYENALKASLKPIKFKEKQWELMHKIIHAKAIEKFLYNYSGQASNIQIEGETDPIKKTSDQWVAEIKKISSALVNEDQTLLGIRLESVKSFFYFKDIDIESMPTVYDWVVNENLTNHYWMNNEANAKKAMLEKAIANKDKSRDYIRDYWEMQLARQIRPVSDNL